MATEAPYVTKNDIEAFLRLDAERLAMQRGADDLKKQAEPLKQKLMSFVQANGGIERAVKRSGYLLRLALKKCAVQWKPEFVRVAGVEAAEAIAAAAPMRDELNVEQL